MQEVQFNKICRLCLAITVGLTLQGIPSSPCYACGTVKTVVKTKNIVIEKTTVLRPGEQSVIFENTATIHRAYISAAPSPVRFAGEEVFSIPTPAGGFTAEERTMIVERNLNNALIATTDRSPDAVKVEIVNNLPVIRLGEKHVVTVDTLLATANHTNVADLANRFAGSLRQVLAEPDKVDHYLAQMDGNFLFHPYSPPAWRERWQGARLNHAAFSYLKDLPIDLVSSQSLKNQGFDCLMKRDPVAAEAFFTAALRVDPENERARFGLGVSQLKQGRVEHALMNLGMARALEPDDPQVHMAIGETLESMGHDQEAIVSYKTASSLQPENPEPALYVADLREERDQISTSVAELNQAMMGCPESDYLHLRKKDQVAWRLSKPY